MYNHLYIYIYYSVVRLHVCDTMFTSDVESSLVGSIRHARARAEALPYIM